jgi:hypothetical protein
MGALPDRPVVASDDLDIAWQVLLGDVPAPSTSSTVPPSTTSTTTAP